MPRAPSDTKKRKRDARLRPLHAPVDPWGWIVEEPVRHVEPQPIEYNIHGLETKPSFYEMVKAALLADKMQYLRGVSMNAIYRHVAANWPVDLDTYRRLTRVAVKRAVEAGKLETVNAVGTTYRLAPEERPHHGEAKSSASPAAKKERTASNGKVSNGKIKRTDADVKKASTKKRKMEDSNNDEDEQPPKKVAKKKTKAPAAGRGGRDFDEKQPGEGKWVRSCIAFSLLLFAQYRYFALSSLLLQSTRGGDAEKERARALPNLFRNFLASPTRVLRFEHLGWRALTTTTLNCTVERKLERDRSGNIRTEDGTITTTKRRTR